MKHSFCEDWEFTRHWTEAFGKGLPVPKQQAVRLPHTCREVPLHYASPADYEMVCGYRKRFRVPPVQAAPRLFLRFDGAAHQAVVRVNGKVAGQHRGGYTGFTVEITDLVDREGENLLTVQLDTREDPAIPPFGFVIDYLTYGGLYREVWLEATAESRLTDLFVYTPTLQEAVVQWTAELTPAAVAVRIRLETADGTLLAQQTAQAAETGKMQLSVPEAQVTVDSCRAVIYGGLFCLAVAMVLRLVPYVLGLTVIVLALWFLDRHALKTVDWGLLATFAAFFTFSGNLARMEPVRVLFARLLSHGTMLVSALTCQIISNVPAAILLSRFTQDARALLVGVNVGGAGTLVASLASLITFREYTRRVPNGGKRFLLLFSGISFAFLAILLTVMSVLM